MLLLDPFIDNIYYIHNISYIQMLQKTYEILKEFQAHEGYRIRQINAALIEKRPGFTDLTIDVYDGPVQADLKYCYESKLDPINKRPEELYIDAELDTYKHIGKFRDYGLVDNVFG